MLAGIDLVAALGALDYEQEAGNRFRRDADGRQAVIDVLTVSQRDAGVSQETIGGMAVDAISGMHVAMMLASTRVDVHARLRTGMKLEMTLDVMDVRAGLVMKAYAYRGRYAPSDATDVWRLLEAGDAAGYSADNWPTCAGSRQTAAHLRQFFGTPPARGADAASHDAAARARIRLLTLKLTPQRQPGSQTVRSPELRALRDEATGPRLNWGRSGCAAAVGRRPGPRRAAPSSFLTRGIARRGRAGRDRAADPQRYSGRVSTRAR